MAVTIYKVKDSSKIVLYYKTDPDSIFENITNNNAYNNLTNKFNITNNDIIVIVIPQEALKLWQFFVALSHSKFRKKDTNSYSPKPIIFITALNIFHNYLHNTKKTKMEYDEQNKDFEERMSAFTLDKRKYFLDSSIWHYYLPIEKWNGKEFENNLTHILDAINKNYELNLYNTYVAKEYLEFQTRLMKNSYLESLGGGHHKHIAPFVFHCETEMRIKADNKLKDLKDEYKNTKIKWNVLVIDDYANKILNSYDGTTEKTKTEIIKTVLKEDINVTENPFSFVFHKTPKENVLTDVTNRIKSNKLKKELITKLTEKLKCKKDEVINKLRISVDKQEIVDKHKKTINYLYSYCENSDSETDLDKLEIIIKTKLKTQYDIFLLDYLLGKDTNTGKRELGSNLFINPAYKELTKFKGPLGKYWFFPITAFSKAMTDKIKSAGISHIHDSWYLYDGADPIATPQLFRYNLFKLIELQLQIAFVRKQDIIDFILENMQGSDNNDDNLRVKARILYGLFMHKFGMREALKSDAENNSAFAKSVGEYLDNEGFEDQRFYEYARKLIFLIGYGTHYDAPRMWEIFTFIRDEVNKLNLPVNKQHENNKLFERITNYLNTLTNL